MFSIKTILPQSSFGLAGNWVYSAGSATILNSVENNPGNYVTLKDWGLTFTYGGEFSSTTNSSLYLISLSKNIGNNTFMVRYTPGYQKDFIFKTGESIVGNDSTIQSLEAKFSYKELFGLGYSYKFNNSLSAGFSMRYFKQEFSTEEVSAVFQDTVSLTTLSESENLNNWRTDIGVNYFPIKSISLSVATINLFNFGENSVSEENQQYELRKEKKVMLGFDFSPSRLFGFNFIYETGNSFQTGINSSFSLLDGDFSFGLSLIHDEYQSPYIAGIIPAISYTSKYFGISFSGIKYFSGRSNIGGTITDFRNEGISNIINNKYSFDKALVTVSFTLNTVEEKSVEIIGVDVLNQIYPTLSGSYLTHPFAKGRVVNLTDAIGLCPSVRPQ